ncbi:uncharacterized protein CTRU02_201055 [Colletotrichum truncatum]|uniref:Uncharacterized protein n=1 Tax=Colletotrichum truncatum TaxID=5467 RepID=A0ACC3ZG86_COLTU|nr:uncharacterized protein CTRU02_12366 [Colletotrichum truncatum]KAF6784661.1 hypothetical protein CTRU02_12366 [Colletotrichum truncatum]
MHGSVWEPSPDGHSLEVGRELCLLSHSHRTNRSLCRGSTFED